ncbi:tyrosine-type recombinase/integrase [Bradyrhizobium ottawaense]|uniref:tyrosine-type recombinase/integrase n=1 Tax=Bradyrhizobium ottawaense TaxID=931866 RepID=UPI0035189580
MDQHSPADSDPAYELVESYGFFKLVRARASGRYYVSWYDAESRQTRRASLRTNKPSDAHEKMRFLADLGITGDPAEYLNKKQVRTVAELLDDDWETYLQKLPSAEAAGIARDILKREMGEKRLTALVPRDYDAFRDTLKAAGKSIGYVSRILSVFRSAGNRALANKQTTVKLKVPEYQPRSKKKGLKKKGPLLTCEEIAAIIDEINDAHLLLLMLLLIHLGARVGALLDAIKAQIDLEQNLFDLNPPGRETTNKGRPVLPIPATLRPWLAELPDGPLIKYRGAAIAEADTAFNSAVKHSKIGPKANTYSIRHSLARYMRKKRVDLEEIGIYLGHGNHDPENETTLIYCPWEPDYLINCREAAEAFVREINTHTRKWDLLRPYCVKPSWVEN